MLSFVAMSLLALSADPVPLYQVQTEAPAEVTVGQPAKLKVRFTVAKEAHISPDAPLALKFSSPDGVTFAKPVLHYKDAVPPPGDAPSFEQSVTAGAPGTRHVDVAMSFYVCTKDLCDRKTETRTLKLTAK